jgi:polyisoprenoid-binding protein YceI
LEKSHAKIEVDLNSVISSYEEVSSTLKGDEWFSVKIFPKSIFESQKFTKIDERNYKCDGILTIRDKKQSVSLNFSLEEYTPKIAKVKGYTMIKRKDFGVGAGQWSATDVVKDEVKVEFAIEANS